MVDIVASLPMSPVSESTAVQRSSSLRVSRLHSPEKCESVRRKLDRRRTCIPFIVSSSAADVGDDLTMNAMTDGDNDALSDAELGPDDNTQMGVCVIRIGTDDVEMEEGKVKRTMHGK